MRRKSRREYRIIINFDIPFFSSLPLLGSLFLSLSFPPSLTFLRGTNVNLIYLYFNFIDLLENHIFSSEEKEKSHKEKRKRESRRRKMKVMFPSKKYYVLAICLIKQNCGSWEMWNFSFWKHLLLISLKLSCSCWLSTPLLSSLMISMFLKSISSSAYGLSVNPLHGIVLL